jgi:5'-nucleotidase
VNHDKGDDTDEWALANNYVSVVPCQFDMTASYAIALMNNEWDLEPEVKLNPKVKDN